MENGNNETKKTTHRGENQPRALIENLEIRGETLPVPFSIFWSGEGKYTLCSSRVFGGALCVLSVLCVLCVLPKLRAN